MTSIATEHIDQAKVFYADILDMDLAMDHGWISTFVSKSSTVPQISIASEGGSGTPVPDISIEVDNFSEVYQRVVDKGLSIEYGPVLESSVSSIKLSNSKSLKIKYKNTRSVFGCRLNGGCSILCNSILYKSNELKGQYGIQKFT